MEHSPSFKNRILNCRKSDKQVEDWSYANAVFAEYVPALRTSRQVAESIDLRKDCPWWKIQDQKLTGSCVGWAVADGLLRWVFTKNGKISGIDQLSPRFIWMAAKELDEFTERPTTFIEREGTSLKTALDIARKYGCVKENLLRFNNNSLYKGAPNDPNPLDTFYAIAAKLRINSYFNLNPVNMWGNRAKESEILLSWRRWLESRQSPILVRLDVDDTFLNAHKSDGVLSRYKPETATGGHAVVLVGYDQQGFYVRNSWGDTWGKRGYAYAKDEYAVNAFTEAYGVTA